MVPQLIQHANRGFSFSSECRPLKSCQPHNTDSSWHFNNKHGKYPWSGSSKILKREQQPYSVHGACERACTLRIAAFIEELTVVLDRALGAVETQ